NNSGNWAFRGRATQFISSQGVWAMTKVRRLLAVSAFLAAAAALTSPQLWGDSSADKKKGVSVLPSNGVKAAAKVDDSEQALAQSKFDRGGVTVYKPLEGDPYVAFGVKPKLDAAPALPRDYLVLVNCSAGQAGVPWQAAKQIAQGLIDNAGAKDRISLWILSTPEDKYTRSLTKGFESPKDKADLFKKAMADLKEQHPAGDTYRNAR